MSRSGIYVIRLIGTDRCYVGSARVVSHRMARHRVELINGTHHSSKLQRAWDKHGQESFSFETLEVVQDVDSLIQREQFWIDELRSAKSGFNILPIAGSHLGAVRPPETGRRISEAKKGIPHSAETKAKISMALMGNVQSAESRAKLAASNKGRVPSEETRLKISAALTGKRLSPETIAKISESKRGKPQSEEHRAKVAGSLKGRPKSDAHVASATEGLLRYIEKAKASGEGRFSPEARARMSQTQKSMVRPQSVTEAARARAETFLHSPDARAKAAQANTGKVRSDEFKRAASERMKGTKASDEARAKMAESARRRWAAKKAQAQAEK